MHLSCLGRALNDYVIRVHSTPDEVSASEWDELQGAQDSPTPFFRHAYLAALHDSYSACSATGWQSHWVTLRLDGALAAATVIYLKNHSYGEYVFDWAWASAYAQHGVPYYPKVVVAVPFTPVPGCRLLARDNDARGALVQALIDWCEDQQLSSLHLLFGSDNDIAACAQQQMMLRHTVQFHWTNAQAGYVDFDAFLASLSQEKRKKIKQERRKVADAGVTFRHAQGAAISEQDWDFFYCCYERTYLEHGNAPYLNRDFFARMAATMPENWLLFIAQREGRAIASSLLALSSPDQAGPRVAYGRYWGALERVDCLHFEACFYQPLLWCIEQGIDRFEGGAQGEHKMARALMPVKTTSAHWLAHPAFADAVARFLEREDQGVGNYLEELQQRNPFRAGTTEAGNKDISG
jgi:predicted N-acyltransferase